MNVFALRLALLGSGRSLARPLATTAGIAVGVAMLLLLLGGYFALELREDRSAWLQPSGGEAASAGAAIADDRVAVAPIADYFNGRGIDRLDVAATAGSTVPFPGIGIAPRPGSYRASPAMQVLIESVPSDQLGDRYGTYAGPIADDALLGPDQLAIVVGRDLPDVLRRGDARILTEIVGTPQGERVTYQVVLAIGAIGMFFPVLLFVGIVTQLGAAQRQERLALLRLIGASRRWVAGVAALETLAIGAAGAILGIGLYVLLRPLAARITLNGGSFFPDDLALGGPAVAAPALAMVAASALAAWLGTWRARIAPLGAAREFRERRPGMLRALPLLAGLALLVAMQWVDLGPLAIVGGFVLTAAGLVVIGPWLTFIAGAAVRRHARTAPGIIAASRIRSRPAAIFRSVSGLILAVFMVSVFTGAAGGIMRIVHVADEPGRLPTDALVAFIGADAAPAMPAGLDPAALGATAVGLAYAAADESEVVIAAADARTFGMPEAAGEGFLRFSRARYLDGGAELPPAAAVAEPGPSLRPLLLVVRTDGADAAKERARTAVQRLGIAAMGPFSRAEAVELSTGALIVELAFIAYLGTFISIAIAGCSLAVSTVSAMLDRRRVLGLLRIVGMPVAAVRRVVAFEAAVPLLGVLAASIGLGFLVAWLLLAGLSDYALVAPEPMYFATVAAGILLAFAIIAATFGIIRRSTGVSATRFE